MHLKTDSSKIKYSSKKFSSQTSHLHSVIRITKHKTFPRLFYFFYFCSSWFYGRIPLKYGRLGCQPEDGAKVRIPIPKISVKNPP